MRLAGGLSRTQHNRRTRFARPALRRRVGSVSTPQPCSKCLRKLDHKNCLKTGVHSIAAPLGIPSLRTWDVFGLGRKGEDRNEAAEFGIAASWVFECLRGRNSCGRLRPRLYLTGGTTWAVARALSFSRVPRVISLQLSRASKDGCSTQRDVHLSTDR